MKYAFVCLFLSSIFLALPFVNGSSFGHPAFSRYGICGSSTHKKGNDEHIEQFVPYAVPPLRVDKPKGYLGSVAIVGGSDYSTAPAYLAAMAALRVGADVVHIICTQAVGSALQSIAPDIIIHPLFDVDHEKLLKVIETVDIVLIGPGIDKMYIASLSVIHKVIDYCKANKKPLVLDLDPMFLTEVTLGHLNNYPPPGFILIMNTMEFEVFYNLIKSPNSYSNARIDVDFSKIGRNFLIYRKGCTDTAFSPSVMSSWSYSAETNRRRTAGQGDIVAGATAVYFHWTINYLPANYSRSSGPMLPAAVAAYQSATLMRAINKKAYEEKGMGTTTTDMLERIPDVLYAPNDLD